MPSPMVGEPINDPAALGDAYPNIAQLIGDEAPAQQLPVERYGLLPVAGELKRVSWDHSDPEFATTLAARGEPVVLLDSPHLRVWKAPGKWTPKYLAQHVQKSISFSHNADGPNFMFYREHGKDDYNSSVAAWRAPSGHKSLTVKEFNKLARKAAKKKPKEYLYYYKNVGPNTPFKSLLSDISPYTWFVVDRQAVQARQRGEQRKARGGSATAVCRRCLYETNGWT